MRRLAPYCLLLAFCGPPGATGGEPPAEAPAIRLAPAPPTAVTRERMRAWHLDARGRIEPILREWKGLARAARQRPGSRLVAGCRRLGLALGSLDRGRLPLAPDPSVSLHLEETLRALAQAASSCTHGAYFLTSWRLREADLAWRELRGRLSLYDLAP